MARVIIDIEVIVIGSIILFLLIWWIWFLLSKKYHSWRYKPENDKARQGEESRKRGEGDREIATTVISSARSTEPAKRELLQTTETSTNGETSNSSREISKKPRTRRKLLRKR